jgi:hypothetical protein
MHLYIIQSDVTGAFKVGRSKNPKRRLSQLQTGSPYQLKLVCILENRGYQEKLLHQQLDSSGRRCKGEWFDFDLIGYLPDDIVEILDLETVNTWWEN